MIDLSGHVKIKDFKEYVLEFIRRYENITDSNCKIEYVAGSKRTIEGICDKMKKQVAGTSISEEINKLVDLFLYSYDCMISVLLGINGTDINVEAAIKEVKEALNKMNTGEVVQVPAPKLHDYECHISMKGIMKFKEKHADEAIKILKNIVKDNQKFFDEFFSFEFSVNKIYIDAEGIPKEELDEYKNRSHTIDVTLSHSYTPEVVTKVNDKRFVD